MPLWVPPIAQLKPYIEVRERYERRVDRDFYAANADNRSDLLSRWRVGLNARLTPEWRAEVQYQYAHDLAWTAARNFSTENSDLSLLYTEGKLKSGTLTLGRQKISLGDQRLIGAFEWSNVSRSFDAVRYRTGRWDLWAGRVGLSAPLPGEARLAAATYQGAFGTSTLIFKHDEPAAGEVNHWTLDHLAKRSFYGLDFEFEGAVQSGAVAGRRHEAWALHGAVTRRVTPQVSAYLEANAASGGSGAASRTFDNLYPTNHNKYGIMDLQSWRNMNELVLGANWKVRPDLLVHVSYHVLSLRDPADAWYGAGGAPNAGRFGAFRDPAGMSGRDVGRELDLDIAWNVRSNIIVQAGLAVFDPGNFVRAMNGGDATRQVWGYLQVGVRY